MSDRNPDDDEYRAWLRARECGLPGPPISDARARRYAQLGTLIADLPAMPAGAVHRSGWEHEVLAVFDAEASRSADHSVTAATAATEKPLAEQPTTPKRQRRWVATAAAAVSALAASVAIVIFMHRDRGEKVVVAESGGHPFSAQTGGSGPEESPGEVTRGTHVEQGRLRFDHALQSRRAATAVARELHDGDIVVTGDSMCAAVVTSADAHLYLAFCANQHLQVLPSLRGVRTRAADLVLVPDGCGGLEFDHRPGPEVLYLIVSRDELSHADPQLAALMATASETTQAVDCGASLDTRLMKSTGVPATSNVLRGERTGTAVAADADGIAIVRYRFLHVGAEHVDDPMKPINDAGPGRER